jgi:3-hydroxybutyryl-CoA dehydrogenase
MSNVLVIGSGTMGASIAQVIAQHNHEVTLFDQSALQLEKGRDIIEKQLAILVKKEKISQLELESSLNRIE